MWYSHIYINYKCPKTNQIFILLRKAYPKYSSKGRLVAFIESQISGQLFTSRTYKPNLSESNISTPPIVKLSSIAKHAFSASSK